MSPTTARQAPADQGARLERALERAETRLLEHLGPCGHWRGQLSASALSTATATFALHLVMREQGGGPDPRAQRLIDGGLDWLARNINDDGGWGDTVRSRSNPSTTLLCWAALQAAGEERHGLTIERGKAWLQQRLGNLEPAALKIAIQKIYGKDRTFSIPILTLCALAGVLGPPAQAFRGVTALPFELAALPQSWFRYLGLPVVSYALPALIAVGQAQHHQRPSRNPLLRAMRQRLRQPTLRRLTAIQPLSGGFLEAVPLTSFVMLSLAGAGEEEHPVVELGLQFLERAVSPDGSWPIDVDLATWVTTLSVQALSHGPEPSPRLDRTRRQVLRRWLLDQQYRFVHPFTGAAPGGWAWTDLPGGVPDADDTPGALLALRHLGEIDSEVLAAAEAGLGWLLDLQNRDGGIPTFCRGWGKLPFDRSACDLTAHALRAFVAWRGDVDSSLRDRIDRGTQRGLEFLRRNQRPDGAWLPLWFGNEAAERLENPTYGTARVLLALQAIASMDPIAMASETRHAEAWLVAAQNQDGSWGGDTGIAGSIEETAVAVEALAGAARAEVGPAVDNALDYLTAQIAAGALESPTPIGFYFANLWYFEQLYPVALTVAALRRVRAM